MALPALLLASDGSVLTEYKSINRQWVTLDKIAPHVVNALIATEDHRFYQHHGIDFRRTAGALLSTLSGDLQGGSTITQQLARNLYPEEIGRATSITRKVKEAMTAPQPGAKPLNRAVREGCAGQTLANATREVIRPGCDNARPVSIIPIHP